MLTLVLLSCSVAADATAVAIAASARGITFRRGLAMACSFGAAQGVMAGIGLAGGTMLVGLWRAWGHWVALLLLTAVGVKMIKEALEARPAGEQPEADSLRWPTLFVLALATSIDALAVGVSLPALRQPPALALAMIGVVTFLFTSAGAALGRFLGERFGRVVEIAGGVGLIAIGVSIAVGHTR